MKDVLCHIGMNDRRVRLCLFLLCLSSVPGAVKPERAYPLGCSGKPREYFDYDNYTFPPPGIPIKSTNDYQLLRRLGSGKFSDVFEAVNVKLEKSLMINNENNNVDPRTLVVLKCLKPVSDRKIRREMLVLSRCSGLPNLVSLLDVVVPTTAAGMPTIVLQHAGVRSQWLCHGQGIDPAAAAMSSATPGQPYLSEYEIQYYIYHLLVALDSLHAVGIMHRDVKPRNVLINKRRLTDQPLLLIDLGLAEFYLPDTKYNVRVASRHYKSPELLVGYLLYDYAIDMWAVGSILAGLLCRREPFFRGRDNMDQLGKIIAVLGTGDLLTYMTDYEIELKPDIRKVISKYVARGGRKKEWREFLTEGCPEPSPEGLDLLDHLLVYDHDKRLTAKQAMTHPFFDTVRDRIEAEVLRLFPKASRFPHTASSAGMTSTSRLP